MQMDKRFLLRNINDGPICVVYLEATELAPSRDVFLQYLSL